MPSILNRINTLMVMQCAAISVLFLAAPACSSAPKTVPPAQKPYISIQSNLIEQFRSSEETTLKRPEVILRALFEQTGNEITVYPSEFYWYFHIPVSGTWIRGTIVWDLEKPNLELSYYQVKRMFLPDGNENFDTQNKDGWVGDLANDLGCEVGDVEKGEKGLIRRVNCLGIAKVFHYPYVNQDRDANRARLRAAGVLLPGEEHWGDFIDESGLRFSAIYLPSEKIFIETLHPGDERLVRLTHYPKQQVYHDANSDFVFYKDGNRYILIGVYKFHVLENDMFDGPHDQLPHADMWAGNIEMIGSIIPKLSTYHSFAAVDQFGNLKNYPGARFVIADHINYEHINDFKHVPACARMKKSRFACLTDKKDK